MCLISWERTQKRDPHKLFRGDFGGPKGGPKRAIFGHKKFSLLFFPGLKSFWKSRMKVRSVILAVSSWIRRGAGQCQMHCRTLNTRLKNVFLGLPARSVKKVSRKSHQKTRKRVKKVSKSVFGDFLDTFLTLWAGTPKIDTEYDRAKVPPYNGNDPRPPW